MGKDIKREQYYNGVRLYRKLVKRNPYMVEYNDSDNNKLTIVVHPMFDRELLDYLNQNNIEVGEEF